MQFSFVTDLTFELSWCYFYCNLIHIQVYIELRLKFHEQHPYYVTDSVYSVLISLKINVDWGLIKSSVGPSVNHCLQLKGSMIFQRRRFALRDKTERGKPSPGLIQSMDSREGQTWVQVLTLPVGPQPSIKLEALPAQWF